MVNVRQLFTGLMVLAAGTAGYLFARPLGSAWFLREIPDVHAFFLVAPNLLGQLGGVAPSFFHTLALSLMLMAFLETTRARVLVCLAWFCVEVLFESAQMLGPPVFDQVPVWILQTPPLGQLAALTLSGVFDVSDLLAISAGSLVAVLVGELFAHEAYFPTSKMRSRKC
jgi:hypothetical protein